MKNDLIETEKTLIHVNGFIEKWEIYNEIWKTLHNLTDERIDLYHLKSDNI